MSVKKQSRPSGSAGKVQQVERVTLPARRQRRRGKHHGLIQDVLRELETLRGDSAVKIQLLGIPAKTLRSAVFRAVSRRGIQIASFSDSDYLYILRKSPAAPHRDLE